MSESVYVKFIRPHEGYAVGAVAEMSLPAAVSLIRKGRAVLAPADLLPTRPALSRQVAIENAMASEAPEMAVTRRGLW